MAISSPGLASGIDIKSIVSQLVALERAPLAPLQQQAAGFQAIHHPGGGRRVQPHQARQAALVQARLPLHRQQRAVLHGGDAKALCFLQENGHGHLLQAADVMTGQCVE